MERNTDQPMPDRPGSAAGMDLKRYSEQRTNLAPSRDRVPEILTPIVNRIPSPLMARNKMRRQADTGLNLVTLLALAVKRRFLMAGLFALFFAPVIAYVLTAPKKYDAEVKLILKRNRADVAIAGAPPTPAAVGEAEVAAEIELLKGRELHEQVARNAGLVPKQNPSRQAVAEAVRHLETALKIQQIGRTNIISVRHTSGSPEVAALVPNQLAELYLKKHIEVHGSGGAATFFDERTAHYQKQLDEAQRALAQFRQTGDVSLLNDQKQAYLRRATDLKNALEDAESQARDAEVRLRLLAQQRNAQPAQVETASRVVRTSPLAERLKSQLIELQSKRADLLTKYDPQYRLVRDIDQQILEARTMYERESLPQVADSSHAPNPLRQSLEAESLRLESQVGGLRARRETLAADLAEYRGRQSRLELLTANHNDLERSVKIAEENYLLYQRKLEEARLGDALDQRRILNVGILERAEVPVLPAAQHRTYLLLFGFFAAGFGSLAGAFITDYLERNLPAKAPVGGQRATDQDLEMPELTLAPPDNPQFYRRREATNHLVGGSTVVEVESTSVAVPVDTWRELFDRRARNQSAQDIKNGTRG